VGKGTGPRKGANPKDPLDILSSSPDKEEREGFRNTYGYLRKTKTGGGVKEIYLVFIMVEGVGGKKNLLLG